MRNRRIRTPGGFTLAEALLASVVLATCVTAVTMPFTVSAQNDVVQQRITLATGLVEELMEEILAKPFTDPQGGSTPGPDSGETSRSDYDNIDDYDGYTEADGAIRGISGHTVTDAAAAGMTRSVSVEYVYVSGQDASESPTFVRVTVTVQYNGDTVAEITRLVYDVGQ